MNLENLDLVELNAQETQETEGGIWDQVFIHTIVGLFGLGFYNGYHSH